MTATVHNKPHPGGEANLPQTLPLDGFTRWADLKRFVPFSHETIRRREGAGRFPKRVKLGSSRTVAWPNRELHRWMADPTSYRAPDATVAA
ncbi:helix-turn-helix transcriptional regulator [Burkholderia multivorans]|uniref:helix-turn-helix transcriptional regulator n=1 Tax=Burkholderia multivorans TaxID=87883 RepID=UPI001C216BA1|nr:AlpA family phage regulatory protein [Burkholderia multivorans]MBU9221060.1 AlpA family phage regulatory protein [Burkholderia multivorans]MBU9415864.1 AlpA family phage regulatory protein [Burkholderia multivorans]